MSATAVGEDAELPDDVAEAAATAPSALRLMKLLSFRRRLRKRPGVPNMQHEKLSILPETALVRLFRESFRWMLRKRPGVSNMQHDKLSIIPETALVRLFRDCGRPRRQPCRPPCAGLPAPLPSKTIATRSCVTHTRQKLDPKHRPQATHKHTEPHKHTQTHTDSHRHTDTHRHPHPQQRQLQQ